MTLFSNLKKRERNLFCITAVLIIFWIVQGFVVKPIFTKWKQLDEKISADALKLERNLEMIKRKDAIKSDYEKYASAVKMAGSEEEEMAKFLTEIEALATSSSIRVIDIKPRPARKIRFYKNYLVELEAEGDINQVSKFIYDIQNSPQMLRVDKLSLGIKGAGTNLLKCRILVSKILIP
ncbi:MAG: type 4a pilus biogenesis protein PilO [Candidatus Omnitrophota bacterium]|nr:type 4a pilus biogenesis protein PilO [Candidatus Omnitrophota bacterium]